MFRWNIKKKNLIQLSWIAYFGMGGDVSVDCFGDIFKNIFYVTIYGTADSIPMEFNLWIVDINLRGHCIRLNKHRL